MNKVDSGLTSMWVNFFTAAGIPSDVSATYALTFTENRIQNDMLLDLNKEYLRDMGISRMGDVIAILRHAKQVHESAARDRVLSSAGAAAGAAGTKVPVAAVTGRLTVAQTKPSSPASRILEHYTRNPSASSSRDTSPVNSPKLKRKHTETGTESPTGVKKTRLIRIGSPPPAANKASVTEVVSTKQTVFARLGGAEAAKTVATNAPARPVFARLGAKPGAPPDEVQLVPIDKDALKYEGILKSGTVKKVVTVTTSKDNVRKIAMNCTMRADEVPINIKQKLNMPKAKSVKFSQRVEYKEIEAAGQRERIVKPKTTAHKPTSVFNKPERRLSMPAVVKSASNAAPGAGSVSGIKARLGTKNANNLTITRGIFSRLGV